MNSTRTLRSPFEPTSPRNAESELPSVLRPGARKGITSRTILSLLGLAALTAAAQTASLDSGFQVGTGITGSYVHSLAVSPEGKILAAGNFTRVQGVVRGHVAQLNADGTVDDGFNANPGANSEVLAAAYQPDGRVLVGGTFTRVNTVARNRIARLHTDGTLDPTFDPGTGASSEVRTLAVQPDGKVLIGGAFSRINGIGRNGVARLNPDGTVDATFDPGTGVGGERFVDEVLWIEGKILIAGDFPTCNGVARASIARLHEDGSLDLSFDPGTGAKPGDPILGLAIQPDGKILVAGSFTGFNRKPLNNLARLNPDGSLDPSFQPGTGTSGGPISGALMTVALAPGGNILIGGWFDRVNAVARPYLARLLPDGKLDTDWKANADAMVRAIAVASDNKVLLGGNFGRINNLPSARIARLLHQPAAARFNAWKRTSDGQFQMEFAGDPGREYTFQISEDLVTWRDWPGQQCGGGTLRLIDPNTAGLACRFYRVLLTVCAPADRN